MTKPGKLPWQLKLVYFLWFLTLFEPHRWVMAHAGDVFGKFPFPFYAVLIVALFQAKEKKPLLLSLGAIAFYTAATAQFAYNTGEARQAFKVLLLYWLLAVGTLTFVRSPRAAKPILTMLFLHQFVWWLAHGLAQGLVPWHGDYSNYDAYGPLMVIGIGLSLYYALATHAPKERRLAFATSLLCVGGVVASFARGAVLGAGLLVLIIWIRSPRKGRTTALLAGAGVVVVIFASLLSDQSRGGDPTSPKGFWKEMSTMFESSGDGNDNGSDRKALWDAAVKVFKRHPVLGVGANNFGPAAATIFKPGEVKGSYAENPAILYSRALHSSYYQVLCEYGVIGSALFLWLLFDFYRKNRVLRDPGRSAVWAAMSGIPLDLRCLALGLEAGMVGFLATATFYNQLWVPWLYSILIANELLHMQASRLPAVVPARAPVTPPATTRPVVPALPPYLAHLRKPPAAH